MRRRILGILVVLLLAATVAGPAAAQVTPANPLAPHRTVVSGNPLGFLQFGPTGQVEFPMGKGAGLEFGVRVPSLGLLSHVVDMDLESGWMLLASPRFYTAPEKQPSGWFIGPHVEWGKTGSSGTTSTVFGGGLEVGHRWVFPNRLALSLGGIAGGFKSNWTDRDDATNTGSLGAGFIMGVLSIGKAN